MGSPKSKKYKVHEVHALSNKPIKAIGYYTITTSRSFPISQSCSGTAIWKSSQVKCFRTNIKHENQEEMWSLELWSGLVSKQLLLWLERFCTPEQTSECFCESEGGLECLCNSEWGSKMLLLVRMGVQNALTSQIGVWNASACWNKGPECFCKLEWGLGMPLSENQGRECSCEWEWGSGMLLQVNMRVWNTSASWNRSLECFCK